MNRIDLKDVVTLIVMVPLPFICCWAVIASILSIERLEATFTHSRLVKENKVWMQQFGVAGKVMRCSAIIAICISPGIYVRTGCVVEEEITAVPQDLKVKLYPPFIASIVWSVALLGCGIFIWQLGHCCQ